MKFIKSIKDYEKYKNTINSNEYGGLLKIELEIFQNLCKEFENNNISVLKLDGAVKEMMEFDVISVSIYCNGIISLKYDYYTHKFIFQVFDIEDYKYAIACCLGKLEYGDYKKYRKTKKEKNYVISIWDETYNVRKPFKYPETFSDKKDAIKKATELFNSNNYACVKVLYFNKKALYSIDAEEEVFYENDKRVKEPFNFRNKNKKGKNLWKKFKMKLIRRK